MRVIGTFLENASLNCFCRPSEKGSTQNIKNLLPFGSKFFPFRVTDFSQVTSHPNGLTSYLTGERSVAYNIVFLGVFLIENSWGLVYQTSC